MFHDRQPDRVEPPRRRNPPAPPYRPQAQPRRVEARRPETGVPCVRKAQKGTASGIHLSETAGSGRDAGRRIPAEGFGTTSPTCPQTAGNAALRYLRDLLDLADRLADDGEDAVLATVVRVDGSGYGRPGARWLTDRDGETVGHVSGGCLERELAAHAWEWTAEGPVVRTFDTRGNPLKPGGAYNAGCDGVVHVLLQRSPGEPLAILAEAVRHGRPQVAAVACRSDDPRWPVGHWVRHVADGPLAEQMRQVARRRRSRSVTWTTDAGAVEAFVEHVPPPRPLLIFGAGDDARPLAALADVLGWHVTVIDRRPDLASRGRFPTATVLRQRPAEAVGTLHVTDRHAAVVMTHSYLDDLAALPALLDTPAGYVGLLGPGRRAERLRADLTQVDSDQWRRVHTPVGLDLGAVTPEEIAAAVIAEIVAAFAGRPGTPLSQRDGGIHEPHQHVVLAAAP